MINQQRAKLMLRQWQKQQKGTHLNRD